MNTPMNRRRFAVNAAAMALTATTLSKSSLAQSSSGMTAAQIVDEIKKQLNMPWDDKTYRDTFKAGDPNTRVNGIACCFMSTFDVIRRAQAKGLNFVITHEPTFWTDADLVEPIKTDPFYLEKLHFVQKNGMVVFRIHDHWHRVKPEPMTAAINQALAWPFDAADPRLYKISPMRLQDVGLHAAKTLYTRSVRLVGDPNLMVDTIARGGHTLGGNISALDKADVVISSEVREWESVEYGRDLIASGAKKGMIIISHEAGEEAGMDLFTQWMKKVTPSIRTEFVPTHDRLYLV
jgi:putative NIF3 family GTP cyclohydrolase 1 type 2